MSLLKIVLRSLRQHMLSTVITAFSIALASGLLMSVWVVKDQARASFTGVDSGFDGVFGARGRATCHGCSTNGSPPTGAWPLRCRSR